jgi:hypothetical protein
MTAGIEQAIADVFTSLETWLVSTGATASMSRLAWAVLTVLWLGHVAAASRPGRQFDLIEAFGRLIVAGGLLTAVGPVTQAIVLGFDTFRDAGTAVLNSLIGQSWEQFTRSWLVPQMGAFFDAAGPWFTYPWALGAMLVGLLLGILLLATGIMVYLAILFFAQLTLLLAIFLAPLAMALLAAPATQRWAARWAVVVARTALVVFCVRILHAAVLYLAVIVPVQQVASGVRQGFPQPGANPAQAVGLLIFDLAGYLFLMLIGTGIGVYAMLRAEHLIGQFVEGVAFGQGVFGGSLWLQRHAAAWIERSTAGSLEPNVATGYSGPGGTWSVVGGAQEATVMPPTGRAS